MRRSFWTTIKLSRANTAPAPKRGAPPEIVPLHRQRRRCLDRRHEAVIGTRSPRSRIQHRGDQCVDIAGVGAMIDDSRAYRELAVEQRGRWRRDPGLLNIDDDFAIDLVGVGSAIAK